MTGNHADNGRITVTKRYRDLSLGFKITCWVLGIAFSMFFWGVPILVALMLCAISHFGVSMWMRVRELEVDKQDTPAVAAALERQAKMKAIVDEAIAEANEKQKQTIGFVELKDMQS
jgi:hypothetical protein